MSIFEIEIFGLALAPSYYGLMYALGFIFGYLIVKHRKIIKKDHLDDLLFYIFLGVILGGRLGYVLFYNFSYFLSEPLDILKIWEGGMSFHGGVLGVILAMWYFSYKKKFSFLKVTDEVCAILPIGIGLGRLGNYINGELLGYSGYSGIFAVYKGNIGYFPSPLLEFLLEGIILFIILFYYYKKKRFDGQVAALFLIWYGIFRIFVEIFFREPDAHIGYIGGFLTMGEILSLPMIIVGVYYYYKYTKHLRNNI